MTRATAGSPRATATAAAVPAAARAVRPARRPSIALRIAEAGARLDRVAVLSALVLLALALFVNGFRHMVTPDVHVDEMIYTSASQNIATGHGLSVQGQPFFWQPPLFMMVVAPIAWLSGAAGLPTLDATLQLRLFNAAVGAVTAVGMLALGWRLRGVWTGWAMAILYITDPFIIRVTRRLYLEPFATLWVLLALWLCAASMGRWTWRRRTAVGLLFGCALLSKELTFFTLGVPVVLWLRREMSWREPLSIIAVAVLTYLLYPVWAVAEGLGSQFLDLKQFQYQRLVGVFQYSGWNRPGVSFSGALAANAGDYWTSYVCILLAVPATVVLWFRRDRVSHFLAAWSAVSFAFFVGLAKFGTLNDQFFYFLMLPVVAVLGYAYSFNLPRLARDLAAAWRARDAHHFATRFNVAMLTLIIGLVVVRPNVQVWVQRFGREDDNGMTTLVAAIERIVPRGSTIDLPGGSLEPLHFVYPNGEYQLIREPRPLILRGGKIHWLVLSTKDIFLANGIDQQFYDWITAHAVERWSVDEHTFYHYGLYELTHPEELTAPSTRTADAAPLGDARRA